MRLALIALMLLIALWPGRALGEENTDKILDGLDVSGLQELQDETGGDLQVADLLGQLARGEMELSPQNLIDQVGRLFWNEFTGLWPLAAALTAPVLLWAVLRQFKGGQGGISQAAGYVCYLITALALLTIFAGQIQRTKEAVDRVGRLTQNLFPILMTLLSATGGAGLSGMLSPGAAAASAILTQLVQGAAMTIISMAAILAVIGNLSPSLRLDGLFKLAKSCANWLLGCLMVAFLGVMSVQGMLGSAYDSASVETVRYAVDNLMPIVGGEVADTLDVLISSALLVKNAAGVTGLILLLQISLEPVLHLVAVMLMLRVISALTEPVADGPVLSCMNQFSEVMRCLLVAIVCAAVLFMVLVGASLGAGNALARMR
ncbi:MAG TPA: stage III sporulation protein AE [Candidatus Faecaligallichristensenella faecipullorum]|nr:stage III sporulation protein AE [Candidatus Faecaligallichristensenella faecipullorum]